MPRSKGHSMYEDHFFCVSCARYIRKEDAVIGPGGRPLCPLPHMGRNLRSRPRQKKFKERLKRIATSKRISPP